MERHAVQAMMASTLAAALVPTAAGILVAVSATCCDNYLRSRLDSLVLELYSVALAQLPQHLHAVRRPPLRRRFSEVPAFALIAAPCIAVVVVASLPFYAFHTPMGLDVSIASTCCEPDRDHRLVLLHISDEGRIFLNQKQEDWNDLAGTLAKLYRLHTQRTIYISASDEVHFQTLADAIDVAKIAALVGTSSAPNITVRLITPVAANARCPQPVFADSRAVQKQMVRYRHITY
jgi:biopolymer transport protein ExbD